MNTQANMNRITELSLGMGILVLFAVVYGYLLMTTQSSYQVQKHYPDWQGVSWIKAGEIPGVGYFRKHFTLSAIPQRAYFVVSGTDGVSVYVNGKLLGSKRYFGARPSRVIDIGSLLRTGDNLLAIRVESDILGVAPELAGRLMLADASGRWFKIKTDQSWRVLRYEDVQRQGEVNWYSPVYSDLHWTAAAMVTAEQLTPQLPLPVPEYVYQRFPRGDWIWAGNNKVATFARDFIVPGSKIYDAWLGISNMGRYSLVVNDVPVISIFGTKKTMELVNIAPYLQPGNNNIWLQAENESLLPRLLVSGSVTTDEGTLKLDSGLQWKSFLQPDNTAGFRQQAPVMVRAAINSGHALAAISLLDKEAQWSDLLMYDRLWQWFIFSVVVLLLSLLLFVLFYRLCRKFSALSEAGGISACFALFIRPFVPGLIFAAVSLLLPFDLKIDASFVENFNLMLLVPATVLLFEAFILLEMRFAGRSLDEG